MSPQTLRRSTRAEVLSKSPFRLMSLPPEIRSMIYRACLVSSRDITLQPDQRTRRRRGRIPYLETYDGEANVRLKWDTGPQHQLFNINILRTSRRLYSEAAPVLYGCNNFIFCDNIGWKDFSYFEQRLTELSRNNLRRLGFSLPAIWTRFNVHTQSWRIIFDESAWPIWGVLPRLKALPALERLHLRLLYEIQCGDVEALQRVEDCRRNAKVHVEVVNPSVTTQVNSYPDIVRLGVRAIRAMREWGWSLTGDFHMIEEGQ